MELEEVYRPPAANLETPASTLPQTQTLPPFFQAPPAKVGVMSVVTFGFYQLYWFHKQWYRRKAHGEDVIPILRTLFAVWFAYSLFQSVNRQLEHRAAPGSLSFSGLSTEPLNASLLALTYFLLSVFWRMPAPAFLLGLLSFIPLAVAQKRMNRLHAEMGIDPSLGASYSGGDIVALVIGGIWWILILIGLFVPEA